ncbi:MAG: hypothetical protein WAO56_04540 [Miniphocaeibacter sp.]|uniref:hypothetical protein n=1 Tax=Miniphocaeibacter sp. TaxID=3100973 RepID=UPI0017AECF2E|nr:hypothetical protein [Gallicola sp.]
MKDLDIERLVFNEASRIKEVVNLLIENNKKDFKVSSMLEKDYENMIDEFYLIIEKIIN